MFTIEGSFPMALEPYNSAGSYTGKHGPETEWDGATKFNWVKQESKSGNGESSFTDVSITVIKFR